MDWLLFYFTRKQKSRRFTSAKSHSPQENIWLALRESKEKAAHAGDNSEICPLLAERGDSNPRNLAVYRFSRAASSTTPAPLQVIACTKAYQT